MHGDGCGGGLTHVSIVHGPISILGTDVTNDDAIQWLVCFQISDLHNEWVSTMRYIFISAGVVSWEQELCHDDGVVGGAPKSTVPPFARCQVRAVEDEFSGLTVVAGFKLEPPNIAPVSQLSLHCVRPQYQDTWI